MRARTDRAVSQPKPVTMLARWNNPARLTSRGDWLKPAPNSAVVASMVVAVAALYRPNPRWPCPDGLPAAGERGGGQAEEHRDGGEVMDHAGPAGLSERVGCSRRISADRVGSEDGCADEAGARCADQGRCRPAAERGISGASQAGGAGQDQRPGHGEVRGLDPAAWPERQRTDGMARRAVPLPGGALDEESRDENRPGSQTAGQQTASPSRRTAMRAGGFHEQRIARTARRRLAAFTTGRAGISRSA